MPRRRYRYRAIVALRRAGLIAIVAGAVLFLASTWCGWFGVTTIAQTPVRLSLWRGQLRVMTWTTTRPRTSFTTSGSGWDLRPARALVKQGWPRLPLGFFWQREKTWNGTVSRELRIPSWPLIPVGLSAVLASLVVRRLTAGGRRCAVCAYDLSGLRADSPCPECAAAPPSPGAQTGSG